MTRSVVGWLDEWYDRTAAKGKWAPSTRRLHRWAIDRHIAPHVGDRMLDELKVDDIDALDAILAAGGLSSKSRAQVHGTLRGALASAVRTGLLTTNVAAVAGGPSVRRPEVLVPDDQRVGNLLALAAHGEASCPAWVHPFMRLAAFTGARPGELAALRWADVDLDRGELLIRATARADEQGRGYAVADTTKTGHGRRIALDATTVDVLGRWVRCGDPPAALVFGYPCSGYPLPAQLPRKWYKRLAARAGIDERCTLYSLRHWHASWLLANGASITHVAARLGHSNPTLTLNVYGRHIPAGDRAIAELIDRGQHA